MMFGKILTLDQLQRLSGWASSVTKFDWRDCVRICLRCLCNNSEKHWSQKNTGVSGELCYFWPRPLSFPSLIGVKSCRISTCFCSSLNILNLHGCLFATGNVNWGNVCLLLLTFTFAVLTYYTTLKFSLDSDSLTVMNSGCHRQIV